MTIGYFTESCDSVSHTSSSALLLRRPAKLALLGFMSELGYPSMGGLLDAMKWWPESQEPAETGFSVAFGVGGSEGIFEYLKREKRMDAVYGAAMKALSENPGMGNDFIVQGFDWASIADGVVVDVSLDFVCALFLSLSCCFIARN